MNEKHATNFKININNDDEPEPPYPSEISEHKLEKLNQRIVFLSILFPCIIGAFLLFGYLDLKNRVTATRDTGTVELKNLAKDLETSLADLSTRLAAIKSQFPSKLSTIEKKLTDLTNEQKNVHQSLTQLTNSLAQLKKYKASVKHLRETNAKVKKSKETIAALDTRLKQSDSQVKQLNKKIDQEISVVSETAKKAVIDIDKLDEKMTEMSQKQLSTQAVQVMIDQAQKAQALQLNFFMIEINKKIGTLQKKIQSTNTKHSPSTPSKPSTTAAPNQEAKQPKPQVSTDGFQEQDISE